MNIYEYIKTDHKKVAKLFELYNSAVSEKDKLEIIFLITQELILHSDSEANTFYKFLEKHRKSDDEVLHGEEEHARIKNKLAQITDIRKVNSVMEEHVQELKKLVMHHVSEEESKIFNVAKKVISEKEAMILKDQMQDYKEKMLNSAEQQNKEII